MSLDWIYVLNEQAEWKTREDLFDWLSGLLQQAGQSKKDILEIPRAEMSAVEDTLRFIREQTNRLCFEHRVDADEINTRLEGVSVQFEFKPDSLPPLRATSAGEGNRFLDALRHTLLLQFAGFCSKAMGDSAVSLS